MIVCLVSHIHQGKYKMIIKASLCENVFCITDFPYIRGFPRLSAASAHKGQPWRALMLSLLLARTNSWAHGTTSYQNNSLSQLIFLYLSGPSHYLNQCWLIIDKYLANKLESNCDNFHKKIQMSNNAQLWCVHCCLARQVFKQTTAKYPMIGDGMTLVRRCCNEFAENKVYTSAIYGWNYNEIPGY